MVMIEDELQVVAKTGGIKLVGKGDTWINPTKEAKQTIMDNLESIRNLQGNTVLVEMPDAYTYSGIGPKVGGEVDMLRHDGSKDNATPAVDSKDYTINLMGKEFVTFEGLLKAGHTIGLSSIETEMIKADFDSNIFVCKAKVTLRNGVSCESYGDATPANVGNLVKAHSLRMAETRAIARALRWATNIGHTSLEELGDKDGLEASKED